MSFTFGEVLEPDGGFCVLTSGPCDLEVSFHCCVDAWHCDQVASYVSQVQSHVTVDESLTPLIACVFEVIRVS